MSDENDRTKHLEDARLLAKIVTSWRDAEEALAASETRIKESKAQADYWIGQYNRQQAQITKLEARIKELESPLADLARELNNNTGDKP